MSWWNPGGLWGWIQDAWSGIDSAIQWFVQNVVQAAIDMVEQDISDAINGAASAIDDVWTTLDRVWSLAQDAYNNAANIVTGVIPNVINDLENWAEGIFEKIGQGIGDIWSLVEGDVVGLINDTVTNVEHWVMDVVDSVAGDLQNWTNDAIAAAISGLGDIEGLAKRAFDDAWGPVYRDVIKPLETGLDDIGSVVSTVAKGLDDAWRWIDSADHWLEGHLEQWGKDFLRDVIDPLLPDVSWVKDIEGWIDFLRSNPISDFIAFGVALRARMLSVFKDIDKGAFITGAVKYGKSHWGDWT